MPTVIIGEKVIDLSYEEAEKLLPENIGLGYCGGDLTGNNHHADGAIVLPGETKRVVNPAPIERRRKRSIRRDYLLLKLLAWSLGVDRNKK